MFAELLRERARGVAELSEIQIENLTKHFELMSRWNRTVNLTRITKDDEAIERHYIESLFLGVHLPPERLRVVDIGSGAGFPGIPVAILRSDCEINLVEAHSRKAVFLREASRNMPNVRVLGTRAESIRIQFDWLISRAVSYEDLTPLVGSVAPRVALLTGSADPPRNWNLRWDEPIRLPDCKSEFLRLGGVSRET